MRIGNTELRNTSIRPGWFYHTSEDIHVKSLSRLMDTYYKSVGRNSTLLLNFPIMPNGLISPIDSARGVAFSKMVHEIFDNDLAASVKPAADGDSNQIAEMSGNTFLNFANFS